MTSRVVSKRGQILIATVMVLAIIIMLLLVNISNLHQLFLRARSPLMKETASMIAADFNRALIMILSTATRVRLDEVLGTDNHTILAQRFGVSGNIESIEEFAIRYMDVWWKRTVALAYAEKGVEVNVYFLPYRRIVNMEWGRKSSRSRISAVLYLTINAPQGFLNWEERSLIELTVIVKECYPDYVRIHVVLDADIDYGYLLARGWVSVYRQAGGYWAKVELNMSRTVYEGYGSYMITFKERVNIGTPLLVVASDERGVVTVAGCTVKQP